MNNDGNELIRNVIRACAACKHGKARMACKRNPSQCPNRKVKAWLKQIDKLDNQRR